MVDVGLIDYAFHPPLGTLTPHLVTTGPFPTGNYQFTIFNGVKPVSDTFGLLIRPSTLNPYAGFTDGFVSTDGLVDGNVYDQWLCQVGIQHQLASGAWVLTQLVNVTNPFFPILYEVALPGRIGLYVPPEMAMDIYYLAVG